MDAMNILNVSLKHSILTLAAGGWSRRRIARELGINRETVGEYLRLEQSKPAISTPGSEAAADSKPAISTLGSGRQSSCLPWPIGGRFKDYLKAHGKWDWRCFKKSYGKGNLSDIEFCEYL